MISWIMAGKRGVEGERDGGADPFRIDFGSWGGAEAAAARLGIGRSGRGAERFGKQAASQLRFLHQRIDGAASALEASNGFLRMRVAAGALGFVFIERLQQPGREHHAHVPQRGSLLTWRQRSKPDFPGRKTSARIRSGSTSARRSSAALPSVRLTTSKPSSRRIRSPMRCACGLSSASRMRLILNWRSWKGRTAAGEPGSGRSY